MSLFFFEHLASVAYDNRPDIGFDIDRSEKL
jgi:hypothetical protein